MSLTYADPRTEASSQRDRASVRHVNGICCSVAMVHAPPIGRIQACGDADPIVMLQNGIAFTHSPPPWNQQTILERADTTLAV